MFARRMQLKTLRDITQLFKDRLRIDLENVKYNCSFCLIFVKFSN